VEASIWTERMLAALEDGVKGGKWFSLIDKVTRLQTLGSAWQKVAANKGAAGVDGQSIERFRRKASTYLEELSESLKSGTYRPHPVKRVEIPKAAGKTRPLGIPTVASYCTSYLYSLGMPESLFVDFGGIFDPIR
jgi:RNA-directed DNA polymerase